MSWSFFEPMDLFGEGAGAPVQVYRGLFKGYDRDPTGFAECLELDQLEAVMAGKRTSVPRLEAWWGRRDYAFGGRVVRARPCMPPGLIAVQQCVEEETQLRFNSCFANYYRDSTDCIDWHADDEPWLGPWVASVSLGSTRRFWLRRKDDHSTKVKGSLEHGDLLLMKEGCQEHWEHCVPRERRRKVGPRLNLTFRQEAT